MTTWFYLIAAFLLSIMIVRMAIISSRALREKKVVLENCLKKSYFYNNKKKIPPQTG